MKAVFKASLFLRLLEEAESMTPDLIVEPIYKSVMLSASSAGVRLEATDFQGNSIRLRPTGFTVLEAGECTIPAKPLYEIVRRLRNIPDAAVSSEYVKDDETFYIKCATFSGFLKCFSAEAFPELPHPSGDEFVEVDSADLKRVAAKVGVPAGDTGPGAIGGIEISFSGGKLWLAGHDPNRLAACAIPARGPGPLEQNVVGAKGMKELQKMLRDLKGSVRVFSGTNQTILQIENGELILQQLAKPLQDWRQLLRRLKPDTRLVVDTPRFVSALDRITTLAGTERRVFFDIGSQELKLHTRTAEMGGEETLPLLERRGNRKRVAFNGGSLMELIKTIDADKLVLEVDSQIGLLFPDDKPEETFVAAQMVPS
jgi:DNA polymerase III sliding clamp (beta) subunit (PCNA family)